MFGNRFTDERKRRALRNLERAKQEFALAQETIGIEREEKVIKKQTSLLVEADKKITSHQLKLLQSTNSKLVAAQITGMTAHLDQTLPQLLEARQKAGAAMIAGSLPQQIQAVKDRATR